MPKSSWVKWNNIKTERKKKSKKGILDIIGYYDEEIKVKVSTLRTYIILYLIYRGVLSMLYFPPKSI